MAAAVALAGDTATLRGQRAQLREQMAASPLCDITRYVTHFEALLQRMWALYCGADQRRVIVAEQTRPLDPG